MSTAIAILSDIHGNLEALQAVLAKCRELQVTHYVCLGDIVGYQPNPKECIRIIQDLSPLGIVKGNHDEYAALPDLDLSLWNPMAACAICWTRQQLSQEERQWLLQLPYTQRLTFPGTAGEPEKNFLLVHGTMDNPEQWGYIFTRFHAMDSMQHQGGIPLCFCGHTHVPAVFCKDFQTITRENWPENAPLTLKPNATYLLNVGAVGQPRDGNPDASFAVYTPDKKTVQLFRVPYDRERTKEKLQKAGLPEQLRRRLDRGL